MQRKEGSRTSTKNSPGLLQATFAKSTRIKRFYIAVVRSAVDYGAQVWNGNLTKEQVKDIERSQKRAMKIICPELDYYQAIGRAKHQVVG